MFVFKVQKGHGKAAADLNCSVLSLGTVTGDIHMYDSSKNELFAKLVSVLLYVYKLTNAL